MIGVIILAAGESRRLGTPKQLLPWRERTLLGHVASIACDADIGPVAVVLGSHAAECSAGLAKMEVSIIHNENWKDGMGGSIAAGMKIRHHFPLEAVILMLCDQPFIDAKSLQTLASVWRETGSRVVACRYDGIAGSPALFTHDLFSKLESLSGPEGARSLIRGERSISYLDLENAAVDIDTPDDWEEVRGTYG